MKMEAELSYEKSVKFYRTALAPILEEVYIFTAERAIISSLQPTDKFHQWDAPHRLRNTAISDDTKCVVPRDMSVPLSTPHGDVSDWGR
jgi:hypothetical protein